MSWNDGCGKASFASISPVALSSSDANWFSGVSVGGGNFSVLCWDADGDRNTRSEAVILVETRLGGAAKAARPLERRPERDDAGDCLLPLREPRGLAVEVKDGLRALRSRRPSALVRA